MACSFCLKPPQDKWGSITTAEAKRASQKKRTQDLGRGRCDLIQIYTEVSAQQIFGQRQVNVRII